MAVHARLKNEFTEDEKYHNLLRWLNEEGTGLNPDFNRSTDKRKDKTSSGLFPHIGVADQRSNGNNKYYEFLDVLNCLLIYLENTLFPLDVCRQ